MDLKPILPIDTDIDQTNYYWFQNGFNSSELEEVEKLKDEQSSDVWNHVVENLQINPNISEENT